MGIDDHQLDDDFHDDDECEVCIERNHAVACECRCGSCCDRLLIEASLRDAEREPRIAQECGPIYCDIATGTKQHIGYLLNDPDNGYACRYLNRRLRLCSIYPTRPLVCRVFTCDDGSGQPEDLPAPRQKRFP